MLCPKCKKYCMKVSNNNYYLICLDSNCENTLTLQELNEYCEKLLTKFKTMRNKIRSACESLLEGESVMFGYKKYHDVDEYYLRDE